MTMRNTKMMTRCTFCRMLISDPGSLLLSKVNQDNLINWCEIMLKIDSDDVVQRIKNSWVCIYCIWDARFYHENTGGNENMVWWKTDDALYKYFKGDMMKPCEMYIKKLTDYQLYQWTARKNKYECVVCGLKHHTQNAMYLHMLWKHPERKFEWCRLCGKYIDVARSFAAHIDECHRGEVSTSLKSKVLQCQFCKQIFTGLHRKYRRSQHIKIHHSEIAVRCAHFLCCRYFKTQAEMEKHAKEKHDNVLTRDKLCCIFCGVSYLGLQMLKNHVKQKHKRKAHFCPRIHCGKHFATATEVTEHEKADHENAPIDEKIECTICQCRIQSIRVHHHMRNKHPKEAFKCKKIVCDAYFKTKKEATEHFQATHYADKNVKVPDFFCDQCKFQTKWRHNLECHMCTKHFPRTMKCPDCPKMFATQDHINEHARKTHSKNRRKCPHCDMTPALYNTHVVNTKCLNCCQPFKCFTLVKKHFSTCKLTFDCDVCNKAFTIESTLIKHFNSMHRKVNKNTWLGEKKHKVSGFKCEPCKIYFPHEGFFNSHHKNIHKDSKKVTCHLCNKLVRCKSRMEYHLVHVHSILKQRSSVLRKQKRAN